MESGRKLRRAMRRRGGVVFVVDGRSTAANELAAESTESKAEERTSSGA